MRAVFIKCFGPLVNGVAIGLYVWCNRGWLEVSFDVESGAWRLRKGNEMDVMTGAFACLQ